MAEGRELASASEVGRQGRVAAWATGAVASGADVLAAWTVAAAVAATAAQLHRWSTCS